MRNDDFPAVVFYFFVNHLLCLIKQKIFARVQDRRFCFSQGLFLDLCLQNRIKCQENCPENDEII